MPYGNRTRKCGQAPWCPPNCGGFYNLTCPKYNASDPGPSPLPVSESEIADAYAKIVAAVKEEMSTFTYGMLVEPDLLPGERNATVAVCCDKDPFKPVPAKYTCDCNGSPYTGTNAAYGHLEQCEDSA